LPGRFERERNQVEHYESFDERQRSSSPCANRSLYDGSGGSYFEQLQQQLLRRRVAMRALSTALRSLRTRVGTWAFVAAVFALCAMSAPEARADRDPANCQGSGVNLQLFVFRADGVSDATGGLFTECETVIYQARLCHAGLNQGVPVCNIEAGALVVTTPDGVAIDATPAGGIPELTFDTITGEADCVFSDTVGYTVDPADAVGAPPTVTALVNYNNGISHTGPTDTAAFAGTGIPNEIELCPPGEICVDSFCDPTLSDGVRTGLCTFANIPDSTSCADTDGDLCTVAGCDGQGNCDQNHIITTCTSNDCNTGVCNPDTGLCTPIEPSTPCPDTDANPCTQAGCEVLDNQGICVQTHLVVPDSTPCTDSDQDICTVAGCDAQGTCDQTHIIIDPCGPPPPPVCKHPCNSTIRFDARGTLDEFHVRTGYFLGPLPFDPTADGMKFRLSNINGEIWSGELLPGDLVKRGRMWVFRDRNAGSGAGIRNGISYVSTSKRRDGAWRLRLNVFDDLSSATLPDMTFTLMAGGKTFAVTKTWTQTAGGWTVDLKQVLP
jgi:hypothetical protein